MKNIYIQYAGEHSTEIWETTPDLNKERVVYMSHRKTDSNDHKWSRVLKTEKFDGWHGATVTVLTFEELLLEML